MMAAAMTLKMKTDAVMEPEELEVGTGIGLE